MTSLDNVEYFDITPTICEDTAVFPGDVAFKRNISLSFKNNDNILLSSISSTLHIGAHADSTNHYHKDGQGIDKRKLHYYMGSVQVIDININKGKRIKISDIKKDIIAPRVLFKTKSFEDPNKWNNDFNSLSEELIEYLAEKNVILVGIDTPSVDPHDDKELISHNCIYKNNMAILEGIVLDEVNEGVYQLIALPLKIKNADAGPVRAILIK